MKKLKILLILGILLCFGFMLSSEVHAQGSGPKLFEVGDIMPESIVEITAYFDYDSNEPGYVTIGDRQIIYDDQFDDAYWITGSIGDAFDYTIIDDNIIRIDFSGYSLEDRTVTSVDLDYTTYYWEEVITGYTITFEENGGTTQTDLTDQTTLPNPLPTPTKENHTFLGWYYDSDFTNEAFADDPLTGDVILYAKWSLTSGPKPFEIGDVLPAGLIKISWDFSEKEILSQLASFEIIGIPNFLIDIQESDGVLDIFILPDSTATHTDYYRLDAELIGNLIFPLENDVTITELRVGYFGGDYSYYDYIDGAIFWEVVSGEYLDGFLAGRDYYGWEDDGHWYTGEEAWNMGNEYAKEIYGYYDHITNQWLSVSEYLDLYGTDKPGQSDFYANFDKYFIPAMIIVFGGAIVLTLLKVFKGRE